MLQSLLGLTGLPNILYSNVIKARTQMQVAGTVPMIWSSCTRFMMHKFKPAEFHAATCCGLIILSPKTRNLFIKSSKIRGLASASCPCFMTHKLKPAEFNATCCRDKFCPHNRLLNTTTQQCLPGRVGVGRDLSLHLVPAS